jgi:hypothetical protein
MKLEPLYRATFAYPDAWAVDLGSEQQHFFLAEGRCEGRIAGVLRGANHPRGRADGTFLPDFQGVIETEDGATVWFDWGGYGRAYPAGRRQIVGWGLHLCDDDRYRYLNDSVCALAGEVRTLESGGLELVVDAAEIVWEPVAE